MTPPTPLPRAVPEPIAGLLHTFARQFDADPLTADHRLLEQAHALLITELRQTPFSSELAHTAVKLYDDWIGDAEFLSQMLERYLQQPLTVEEEAWACYEYVNCLTALNRNTEVAEQHKKYVAWARVQWEAGRLSSQRLLRVMTNPMQAGQWERLGRMEERFAIFEDLMGAVPPAPDNRMERFYYLRTACHMHFEVGRYDAALGMVERIRALADEDADWERAYEMTVQAEAMAMRIYAAQGDTGALRRIGEQAAALLEGYWQKVEKMSEEERTRLMIQYDNVAWPLFHARQYALSIPLHRRVLALGYPREFAYLWLAAALWAQFQAREEVLELLRQGAARARLGGGYPSDFAALPEFQDVRTVPDFLAAVATGQNNKA